jgi:hypothetical protein
MTEHPSEHGVIEVGATATVDKSLVGSTLAFHVETDATTGFIIETLSPKAQYLQ